MTHGGSNSQLLTRCRLHHTTYFTYSALCIFTSLQALEMRFSNSEKRSLGELCWPEIGELALKKRTHLCSRKFEILILKKRFSHLFGDAVLRIWNSKSDSHTSLTTQNRNFETQKAILTPLWRRKFEILKLKKRFSHLFGDTKFKFKTQKCDSHNSLVSKSDLHTSLASQNWKFATQEAVLTPLSKLKFWNFEKAILTLLWRGKIEFLKLKKTHLFGDAKLKFWNSKSDFHTPWWRKIEILKLKKRFSHLIGDAKFKIWNLATQIWNFETQKAILSHIFSDAKSKFKFKSCTLSHNWNFEIHKTIFTHLWWRKIELRPHRIFSFQTVWRQN
jgi:hypothetical protein